MLMMLRPPCLIPEKIMPDPKMRVPEAARYLQLAESTLNKMRCSGGGPRFIKAGPRVVLYDRGDLDEWLANRTWGSTSEYVRPDRASRAKSSN